MSPFIREMNVPVELVNISIMKEDSSGVKFPTSVEIVGGVAVEFVPVELVWA